MVESIVHQLMKKEIEEGFFWKIKGVMQWTSAGGPEGKW